MFDTVSTAENYTVITCVAFSTTSVLMLTEI